MAEGGTATNRLMIVKVVERDTGMARLVDARRGEGERQCTKARRETV